MWAKDQITDFSADDMCGQMLLFPKEKGFAAAWRTFGQNDGCRRIVSLLNEIGTKNISENELPDEE